MNVAQKNNRNHHVERELLRVAGVVNGDNSEQALFSVRKATLEWAEHQVATKLPSQALEGRAFEHFAGGRTCIGTGFQDAERVLWALRADRPDVKVPQRNWTVEVAVGYQRPNGSVMFSLRLLVGSPEEPLRVEPAVPGLVRKIVSEAGLSYGASNFEPSAWRVESESDAEELMFQLTDSGRKTPYFVSQVYT